MKNLRVQPAVAVRLGDGQYAAVARVLEMGTDEDAQARRLLLQKYQAPGSTDLESWGRTALIVALDLDASDSGQ